MGYRFLVTGHVVDDKGNCAPEDTTIFVYRRELVRRSVLASGVVAAEDGSFAIEYGDEESFAEADRPPNIELRAFDPTKRLRAASNVFFCPDPVLENVELKLRPAAPAAPAAPAQAEYDRLRAALKSAVGLASVAELDGDERDFAAGAMCRGDAFHPGAVRPLIDRLAAAEDAAAATGLSTAAAYGLLSVDSGLDAGAIAALGAEEIGGLLARAVAVETIAPEVPGQSAAAVARLVARAEGAAPPRRELVRLRLLDAATGAPIRDATLGLSEHGEPLAVGALRSDGDGRAALTLAFRGPEPRRLGIDVRGPLLELIGVAELRIAPGEGEREVRIETPLEGRPLEAGLDELSDEPVVSELARRAIRTVGELLRGPEEIDGIAAEQLARVRRSAMWHAAGLRAEEAEVLEAVGFDGPMGVARIDRARFLARVGAGLGGPERAASFHAAARLYEAHVARLVGDAWIRIEEPGGGGGEDPNDDEVDFADIFDDLVECGCDDCRSALSPGAYLTHMLDWITANVVSNGTPVTLEQLEEGFHQPFSELPTTCDHARDCVRQVRLAIEVLWSFTGGPSTPGETVFNDGHAAYRRTVYRAILAGFGVTWDELLLVQAAAPQMEALRARVAARLAVAEGDLVAFVLAEAPNETALEALFGLRRTDAPHDAEVPLPAASRLRAAELGQRWVAEDSDDDAWGPDQTQPAIDPRLMNETAIRPPRDATNPVFVLYTARAEVLQELRGELEAAAGSAAAFLAEITTGLDATLDELRALRDTLTGAAGPATAEELEAARAQLRDELLLELAAFLRLVEIADALDSEGDAALEDAALAADGTDILVGQQANVLRQDWIDEEVDAGIGLDSALFHKPDQPDTAPSEFLVPTRHWTQWRLALERRSGEAIVDPHHLSEARVVQFVDEGFEPFADEGLRDAALALLEERAAWAESRRAALAAARTGAGGVAAQYAAVLAQSALPNLAEQIEELTTLEAEGHTVDHAAEQLGFSLVGFRRVVELGHRAESGLQLSAEQWADLFAVLVGVEKRLRSTEWRGEERDAGLSLHPRLFRQGPDDLPEGPDSAGAAGFARRWSRRLAIRQGALAAALDGIERAVSEAEEEALTILRDALIRRATVGSGDTVAERRAYLDSRLLVALDMEGCACTTRIAFAIETLQRFLRGILRGDLIEALANVDIDAENLTAAASLLSYQDWRSAMFAFLWPENLTSRVLPARVSHGLSSLTAKLPNRLSPERACELARDYEQHFRDLAGMEVFATCLAPTFLPPTDPCDPGSITVGDRMFLFGHATGSGKSGQVYWAMLDPAARLEDTRTPWAPLGKLGPVEAIVGATVHVGAGKPFLLLLVRGSDGAAATLRLRAFDLDASKWLDPRTLKISDQARDQGFEAAILRKYASPGANFERNLEEVPTLIAIQPRESGIFMRSLAGDLSGWGDGEWSPLQGPSAAGRLKDLVQVLEGEAALILSTPDDEVSCRTVSLAAPYINDDFTPLGLGQIFQPYAGAIGWPGRRELIAFVNPLGLTRYRIASFEPTETGIPQNDPRYEELSVIPIEERLKEELGVSLDDPALFAFEDFKPLFWTPKYVATHHDADSNLDASNYNPLNVTGEAEQGSEDRPRPSLEPFSGTLYELLTLRVDDLDDMIGDWDNQTAYIADEEERSFYLIQYKKLAIDAFFAAIDELSDTDPFGDAASWWGFLDAQLTRLTRGLHGLRSMITQLFYNEIAEWMVLFNWDLSFEDDKVAPIVFEQRLSEVDISGARSGGDREITIAGTAGHDHLAGAARSKPVALWKRPLPQTNENGAYWTVLERSDRIVSAVGDERVTPHPSAAFTILPPKDPAELADRRSFSETTYEANADAPPSLRGLIRELFFLVPVLLGDALCAAGHHHEAQDWLRTSYDAGAEPGARKIDYGLVLEESRPLSFTAIDEWLKDPEDVHAVALTRRESDTRRVLLSIIACIVAEADGLFARDLPEAISEARHLYRRALELLARLTGLTGAERCADIIGSLRFELEGRSDLPIDDFTLRLAEVPEPGILRATVDDLIAIARDPNLPAADAAAQMRRRIAAAQPAAPARRPVGDRIDRRHMILRRAEARVLATEPSRALLAGVLRHQEARRMNLIARILEARGEAEARGDWLALRRDPPRPVPPAPRRPAAPVESRIARARHVMAASPLAGIALGGLGFTGRTSGSVLSFCIPQNPEILALRRRAETALERIRSCRDLAGYDRVLDPYGGPVGLGGQGLDPALPEQVDIPPVPLRYGSLLPQALQLAETAAQIEGRYLHALEGEDRERLNRLQVAQNLDIANAQVARMGLALGAAEAKVELALRQRNSAVIAAEHYDGLIKAGINKHERKVIESYLKSGEANSLEKAFKMLGQIGKFASSLTGFGNPFTSFTDLIDVAGELADASLPDEPSIEPSEEEVRAGMDKVGEGLDALVNYLSQSGGGGGVNIAALEGFRAELKRREEEWTLQRGLSQQDVEIGTQQIAVEQFSRSLAQADLEIAELQRSHAADILTFLQMKNLTAEAYRWMSTILGEAYREVMQRAAATGRMAERALAFERFERPAALIASDYWQLDPDSGPAGVDLRGLTGSARLLRDLTRLQDYALTSLTRRVPVELKVELTTRHPESFQAFRETGVMEFESTLASFQEQLPGYYAASISGVSLELQALSLTDGGLRMTLESRGISRAVIRTEGSRTTVVRGLPEVRYLTGSPADDARLELVPLGEGLRAPFEGTAFEQFWRITADKGANPLFDYESITGLTFSIRGTALYSPLHAAQVRQALGPRRSGDAILSLARDYPAAWAALQEAADGSDPLALSVSVPRGLFPINLDALSLDHLLLAVVAGDEEGAAFDAVLFAPTGGVGPLGGAAETVDGRISTRNASGAMLRDLLDGPPTGRLDLRFAEAARARIAADAITDVIVLLSYSGEIG